MHASFSELSELSYIKFGEDIDQPSAIPSLLKISVMLLHFETRVIQSGLESKIEAKFRNFSPCKIMEGWAKCLSHFFKLA